MNAQSPVPNVKKILVVDDNQVILQTLKLALQPSGYQVLTAAGGPETISAVHKEKPDLILLDINFPPDMENIGGPLQDGFFIIEWLRRTPEVQNIPIILISSTQPAQYMERAAAAGVAGCFHKPIDYDKLLEFIHATLGEETDRQVPQIAGDC